MEMVVALLWKTPHRIAILKKAKMLVHKVVEIRVAHLQQVILVVVAQIQPKIPPMMEMARKTEVPLMKPRVTMWKILTQLRVAVVIVKLEQMANQWWIQPSRRANRLASLLVVLSAKASHLTRRMPASTYVSTNVLLQ